MSLELGLQKISVNIVLNELNKYAMKCRYVGKQSNTRVLSFNTCYTVAKQVESIDSFENKTHVNRSRKTKPGMDHMTHCLREKDQQVTTVYI